MTVSDGLAYGLGHGGIEALFIGIVSLLNFWIIAQAVTQGNAQLVTKIPQATIDYIKSLSAGSIYLLVFERIVAVICQVLLSFWVWKSVKEKALIYFLAALGLHALIDLAPALGQIQFLSPLVVEAIFLGGLKRKMKYKKEMWDLIVPHFFCLLFAFCKAFAYCAIINRYLYFFRLSLPMAFVFLLVGFVSEV